MIQKHVGMLSERSKPPTGFSEAVTLDALEDMTLQTVRADLLDALETVASDPGEDLGPEDPVDETDTEDGPARNGVSPVRHRLVRLASGRGRDEGHDEEEDVGGTEEGSGNDGRPSRLAPVRVGLELQEDNAEGDDTVDDRQRVRDRVDDEVVRVSRRQGEDRDETDCPVETKAGERGVERTVAGPELGEGKDALAAELLVDATLRKDDGQNVAESGESNENRKGTLSVRTHDVAEEESGNKRATASDLLLGRSREVGDVGENVEDSDEADRERAGNLEGTLRVLNLGERLGC